MMDHSKLASMVEAAEANAKYLREQLAAMSPAESVWPEAGDFYWSIDAGFARVYDAAWTDTVDDLSLKASGAIWRTEAEAQAALAEVQAFLRLRAAGSEGVPEDSDCWVAGITSIERAPRALFTGGGVGHCAPQFLRFHTANDARAFVERHIDDLATLYGRR